MKRVHGGAVIEENSVSTMKIPFVLRELEESDAKVEMAKKAISTGGDLLPSCRSLVGEEAYRTILSYNANIAFFSCRGLSDDGYLTDISETENLVRRRLIEHSEKSYLMCASNKIGKKYFHNLCSAKDISGIICEKELPPALSEFEANIK